MKTNRRDFLSIAGASVLTAGTASSGNVTAAFKEKNPPSESMTEMFLDNQLIEVTPSVSRKLHPPRKHLLNPVVRCDRWCDGNNIQPYTTMYDDEDKLFKMWARAGSDWKTGFVGDNAAYMLYFTSTDGIHWDKPDLGVFDVAGRRDHNIVFTSELVTRSVSPLSYGPKEFVTPTTPMTPQGKKAFFWSVNKNPRPRDKSEKFIALAIVQDHRRGAHIVTSPDGIHWSCASSPFWQTPHDVSSKGDDCLMHLIFDEAKDKWVLYRRIVPEFSERMVAGEIDCERPGVDRYYRSYAYAESDDLREWNNHRFILAMDPDDPPDTELYQFAPHKFGETYVGYMSIFYLRRPQPIDVHLATSRDGVNFTRVCRGEAFIPHGPLGYYDFMAMACSQPKPIVVNDTVYFYYAALNFPHNVDMASTDPKVLASGAAVATFKRDRFASLETSSLDNGPCRVITKPFTIQHPKLFLNAATWMKGSIRAEILTRDWQPIAGFSEPEAVEIQGDALDHPVRWKENADVSQLVGQEIRLKFYMTRARIHAMTFANADRPLGDVEPEFRYDEQGDSTPKLS
ncbi:MAG: hypothetical protein O2955_06970 [Planctomycetota bacterium]|nr:hypothetical protein [Planctomycetota bacterium]MDA1212238.1 hypothetical protein [Planctomycetota bacterium]